MKANQKILVIIFTICLMASSVFSQQEGELEKIVSLGIALHYKGDYDGAIAQYNRALKIDIKSTLANYQMALTYYTIKDFNKAIAYCNKVIAVKTYFEDQAYLLKGSSLDLTGRFAEAIQNYRYAIKAFSEDHLFHYHLAQTLYKTKEYKESEEEVIKALKINYAHPSSHLLLANINYDQGKNAKAVLALFNFMMVEPVSPRALSVLQHLQKMMGHGTDNNQKQEVTLTLSDDLNGTNDFAPAELMLSMLAASKNLDSKKDKSPNELFYSQTNSFFNMMGELKKKNKGFYWDFYVEFFADLESSGHTEAFCYYIQIAKDDEQINKWLVANNERVEKFKSWVANKKRKI